MENKQKSISDDSSQINKFANETPEQTAARNAKDFKFSKNLAIAKVQKYFKFDTLGSTFKKEIIGGIVTFLSMVYILSVNPSILSNAQSISDSSQLMSSDGVLVATILATFIGTMLMGLFANVPVAVSASMGMNAMFTFNMANTGGLGYEGALIATFISSILFTIFSITPIRSIVLNSIPRGLIISIGIAIGFLIAYIGFANMGWFTMSNDLPTASIATLKENYAEILVGVGVLALILILHFQKVPGAVIIAIMAGFAVSLIIANTSSSVEGFEVAKVSSASWNYDFSGFTLNIKNTWNEFANPDIWKNSTFYISIFVVMLMNFFDATGTIATFNLQLNKRTNQHHEISHKALMVDSATTVVASALGTSPCGAYVESSAGIEQGARTGFASIITAFMFLSALVLMPIFRLIPQCVTASACVYIGIMMISEIAEVEWRKPEFAIPAFFTILFMVTTYSIANGMAFGFISYTFVMLITGKHKQISKVMWILSLLFLLYLVSLAFI